RADQQQREADPLLGRSERHRLAHDAPAHEGAHHHEGEHGDARDPFQHGPSPPVDSAGSGEGLNGMRAQAAADTPARRRTKRTQACGGRKASQSAAAEARLSTVTAENDHGASSRSTWRAMRARLTRSIATFVAPKTPHMRKRSATSGSARPSGT